MNVQPAMPNDADALRWLEQRAVSLRSRALSLYRAREDDEALRLLDEADATWHMARDVRAERSAQS